MIRIYTNADESRIQTDMPVNIVDGRRYLLKFSLGQSEADKRIYLQILSKSGAGPWEYTMHRGIFYTGSGDYQYNFELPDGVDQIKVQFLRQNLGASYDGLDVPYTIDNVSLGYIEPIAQQTTLVCDPNADPSGENAIYRYGFNGKELDKETSSTTTYDYGFRIYSPALGRFLSVDPLSKKFPYYTPYQYAGNKPIQCIDLDGLEDLPYTEKNQYGEKQVYLIETGFTDAFITTKETHKVTPSYSKPATTGMTDVQVYQLAFNRFAEPGKHLIKSNEYVDERLMKAEQQVGYFYTHNVPGWSKSESATRTIHTAVTAGLFSNNAEYAEGSVNQIKIVDNWDYNINLGALAVGFTPVKAYQNITSGLTKLSRILSRSATLNAKGFQAGWSSADLTSTMDNLLGKDFSKISFEATETGKVLWSNEKTGFQIVQDPLNKYFRVMNKDGHYVGADGKQVKIPSNLKGKDAKDYLQNNTHFNY